MAKANQCACLPLRAKALRDRRDSCGSRSACDPGFREGHRDSQSAILALDQYNGCKNLHSPDTTRDLLPLCQNITVGLAVPVLSAPPWQGLLSVLLCVDVNVSGPER